jgi:hypothetical protein
MTQAIVLENCLDWNRDALFNAERDCRRAEHNGNSEAVAKWARNADRYAKNIRHLESQLARGDAK